MKKILITLLLPLTATAVMAQQWQQGDTVRLTLEECLAYALDNNYGRQSVQLNEEVQQASLDQARMDRLPNLTANASENVSDTRAGSTNWNGSYDISTNVTLFKGGQLSNEIKKNKLQNEQTQLQTRKYDNELTVSVLQSFLSVLGNEELLKYQQALVTSSESQMKEGEARFKAGQIIESDYLLLRAQHAADVNNVTGTQISLDNSLVALKNLMSIDLTAPIALIYPDDSVVESMMAMPTRDEVVRRGLETMPEVRISDYNIEIAETGLRITKAAFYPTLSLSGGLGTGHTRNFNNYGTQLSDRFGPQAGLTMSVPIFNRNATRTRVTQSNIALRQAGLDSQQTLKNIEQSLITEYGNVMSSASRYNANHIRRYAQWSSFEAYSAMFRAGAITTVELLQQQNNYIGAMNDYIQSKYTFMLQRKVLDVYMGETIKM